jgi:hypothetical protein
MRFPDWLFVLEFLGFDVLIVVWYLGVMPGSGWARQSGREFIPCLIAKVL